MDTLSMHRRWVGPRLSAEDFDRDWYLRVNPDVREAGLDPWEHYVAYGHGEGRAGAPVRALELDYILWRGFAREAEVELRLLLRGDDARERAASGWVFARHAASRGRWRTARAAIRAFTEAPSQVQVIPHPGPWLLAVQAEVQNGNIDAARAVLATARARFGEGPEMTLAMMEIVLAAGPEPRLVETCLADLHAESGLARLDLLPGAGFRFDRLCTRDMPTIRTGGPLVSVVVPAFQAEDTLETCLSSLRAQSWRNLDIVVVDDGSTDRTWQVAETVARADPRVRTIRLPRNGGAYAARNVGLAAAAGDFFTVHDADDWSHPQKIEVQVEPLIERPTLQATVSHWVRADRDLRMTRWRMEEGWIHRNVSSLMIRTYYRDLLGYWDRVRTNADTEYYHRLLAAFGTAAVTEVYPGIPLSLGRTHAASLTSRPDSHISTQFAGPRREYMDAAHDWHRRQLAAVPEMAPPSQAARVTRRLLRRSARCIDTSASVRARALHLPRSPRERPFFAPKGAGPSESRGPGDDYDRSAASWHFDRAWYLRRNVDVLLADVDPVGHYLASGAAEERDPGPLFPNAAWRRLADLDPGAVPLLALDGREAFASMRPCFAGGLDLRERPAVMVFAHAAERAVFGAELSLLTTLDRLVQGDWDSSGAPVVVLPSAVNSTYLDQVRSRAVVVEILPQVWRHRFRPAPEKTVSAIRNLIRRYNPQEIHVNTIVLDAPLIAARSEGVPTVVHVRELPAQDPKLCRLLGDTARGLRRSLLRSADRFVANSHEVADWIDCPERTSIWPNLVDPVLFDEPCTPGESLRVGLISSNIAKKGIGDFVMIAARVAQLEAASGIPATFRCRFRLIGPATPDLSALGPLPANTEHAGYAPHPLAAVRETDVVLVLSDFAESFGRSALEALAAGRPLVCYDRGTPPMFIENGVSGFVVSPNDFDGVAERILALSTNRAAYLRMSESARAAASRIRDTIQSGGARGF